MILIFSSGSSDRLISSRASTAGTGSARASGKTYSVKFESVAFDASWAKDGMDEV